MFKGALILFLAIVIVAGLVVWWIEPTFYSATQQGNVDLGVVVENVEADVEVVAQGLEIPWELAWLPDGDMLVTERPGRLLRIGEDRSVILVSGVAHVGEGGLLGMALHPRFEQNNWIYLYLTTRAGADLINRVERYQFKDDKLFDKQVILDQIPGSRFHDGGRIAFGPDGYLYVTVGDASEAEEAQNKDSLNGAILRLRDDGSIPDDNPFNNQVYSYGHRNVQGLAWDGEGKLWVTEHGRSGLKSGLDEINLIKVGSNYGWPVVQGNEKDTDMELPVVHSGADETWAPAGVVWLGDSLFFAGLRGESLYEAKLDGELVTQIIPHFYKQFGRLRAVRVGPDGWIYVTTSNRDGRGEAKEGDDKVIRINSEIFNR